VSPRGLAARLAALAAWVRREPHLALPALLGALALPVLPVYLGLRQFAPVLAQADPFVYDFSYYYEAAARFAAAPGTLYADPEYLYPPPSVLAFLPTLLLPEGWAYVAWDVLLMAAVAVSVVLTWGLYERATGERVPRGVRAALLLAGLASAPTFQNLHYGQVNAFVLVLALFSLWWGVRAPLWAALALCGGFWLKLYPLALAPLALAQGRGVRHVGRAALGFVLGLVALPLVLLPVVPASLHATFWLERLPAWSGMTSQGALNQSIVGVLTRAGLPAEAALRGLDVPAPEGARLTAAVLGLLLGGGVLAAALLRRLPAETAGVLVLALLPALSALGWEHTYVMALPLVLWLALAARTRGRGARLFSGAALLVFMMPRPPHVALVWAVAHVPRPLLDVALARFLLVTLLAVGVGVAWAWRRPAAPVAT